MNEQIENQNVTEVTENKHENTQVFPEALPNAGLVLTLGILSIPFCCCFPLSLPLGITAWVMGAKGVAKYKENPEAYTKGSYSNMNTGKITAIVGVVLTVLFLIYLVYSTMKGIEALGGWDAYMEEVQRQMEQYQ